MTTQEPTHITRGLETFFEELKTYRSSRVLQYNNKITRKQEDELYVLREKLLNDMGRFRGRITELMGKDRITVTPQKGEEYSYDMWFRGLGMKFDAHAVRALNTCIDVTNAAIGKLKSDIENGLRDEQGNLLKRPPTIDTEPPKAFIAHEGMTKALEKVNSFLDATRIKYLIAEIEPSDGRTVEPQVQWTQGKADFAVILATKGRVINKNTGKPYMGMNVADELGRAREVFKNRIILLLQRGVEPHTNVSGIVYEPFTPQNMEKVFIKIARELSNWGYLKAVRTEE